MVIQCNEEVYVNEDVNDNFTRGFTAHFTEEITTHYTQNSINLSESIKSNDDDYSIWRREQFYEMGREWQVSETLLNKLYKTIENQIDTVSLCALEVSFGKLKRYALNIADPLAWFPVTLHNQDLLQRLDTTKIFSKRTIPSRNKRKLIKTGT